MLLREDSCLQVFDRLFDEDIRITAKGLAARPDRRYEKHFAHAEPRTRAAAPDCRKLPLNSCVVHTAAVFGS
jgi:hypothetical protein